MSSNKVIGIAVIILIGSLVIWQKENDTSGSAGNGKRVLIGATVYTTQSEFHVDVIKGMKKVADAAGAKLVISDANGEATKQNNDIEDFVEQKVDGVIIYGVDPVAVVQSAEYAVTRGIPVITCDMKLKTDKVSTFIGSDNTEAGRVAGEYAKKYIETNLGGKARIGVVTWLASVAQQQRLAGFKKGIGQTEGIKIVATQDGDGREKAMASAENIMQANPDLDMFFGTNEGSTIGCFSAVQSAGKRKIKIIGIDISNDAIRGLEEGSIFGLVAQQPVLLGELSVKALFDLLDGKTLAKNIECPIKLVTKENASEFRK